MAKQTSCDLCGVLVEDPFEIFHRVVGHRQACSLACAKKVLDTVAKDAEQAFAEEAAAEAALTQ